MCCTDLMVSGTCCSRCSLRTGSCGRCYEIQCQTGVVVGNYSSDGTAIPYNISNGFTEPGLDYNTLQDGV